MTPDDDNPTKLEADRLAWTLKVRPGVVGAGLVRLLRREAPRMIVTTASGIRLYVDPLSHLGREIIGTGDYEAEMARDLKALIRPGATVLDIGANEGALTCLAARLTGPEGRVIAVEPQRRLMDVLEINCALNGLGNVRIENAALSDAPAADLWLYPSLNTGASSIVRKYRWNARRQAAATVSFAALIERYALTRFDLVKVDVEGYEKEVVDSLAPALAAGMPIGHLLIDYHTTILDQRVIRSADIDSRLREAGLVKVRGQDDLSGYVVYASPLAAGAG